MQVTYAIMSIYTSCLRVCVAAFVELNFPMVNTLAHSCVSGPCRVDRQSVQSESCPLKHTELQQLGFGKATFANGLLVDGRPALHTLSLSTLSGPETLSSGGGV